MKDYSKAGDRQLIADCLAGESLAWEALIHRYQRLIYSIPYKYRLSPDDAADVFQSVCVAILEKLSSLRDESKLSSWIITTTVRECWKLKRRERRGVASLDDEDNLVADVPAEGQLPDEIIQALEEQHLVRRGLELLDQRCRTLLSFLFYEKEDWSYEQIAGELGMPVASIGPTRGRCLKKLRDILRKLGLT
jgi:RNA polymerase sigma factor (sigma-70 family)